MEAGTTINHISWLRLGFKQYGGVTCEYFSTRILGNMQCLNDPVQQLFLELKKEVKMNMNMLRNNMHYGTPDLCNPSCLQQRKPRSDERQVQDKTPSRPLNYIPHPPLPPALACIGLQQPAFIAQTNRRRQENFSNVQTIKRKFQSHPYHCINSIELSRRNIWRPNTNPLLERA